MEQCPSWKATSYSAGQEIPRMLQISVFIAEFTSARHLPLTWVRRIESTPFHPISVRSILILLSHLHLSPKLSLQVSLPTSVFISLLPIRTLYWHKYITIIIIIIISLSFTFMHGIYLKWHVSWVHNVAAVLWLQIKVHLMLFPMINVLYFYNCTFRNMCARTNMAIIIIIINHHHHLGCHSI